MDENQILIVEKNRKRFKPHVLVDIIDPVKNGHSYIWLSVFYAMLFVEFILLILLVVTLNKTIVFKIWIFNVMTLFTIPLVIALPCFWWWHAGHQRRFDENIRRFHFTRRIMKGLEHISKYNKGTPEEVIRSVTGMISLDSETGLSKHIVNETNWSLEDHPYLGNCAYDVIAYPNMIGDHAVIVENFHSVTKALPRNCFKRITMYTGESLENSLDNVENMISDPNISPVRQEALYSIYEHYKDRPGICEPMYIIHIGLPYTTDKTKALENMRKVRKEFETPLNQRKIDTVLIKDPLVMELIIKGMFTGKMYLTGDMIEH